MTARGTMSGGFADGREAQHLCHDRPTCTPWTDEDVEQSLVSRFALQSSAHGRCLAVLDRHSELTYDDLDGWSNGIAQAILDRLGEASEPVLLLARQGAASIAATLGVLKAGKAYVPLDADDTSVRLRGVAELTGGRLVLHDSETAAVAGALAAITTTIALDVDGAQRDSPPPELAIAPDTVAYIFFTSGSTGEPKGVYDNHRNVLHNVLRYTNALRIVPADRLTLLQAPAYSGAVSSQWSALLNGAALVPFRVDAADGLSGLAERLAETRVSVYHSVPSIFRTVCASGRRFPDLRVVRLEGDRATQVDVELFHRHFDDGCILANGLGTTETGLARQLIIRHDARSEEAGVLPVGYPVAGIELVVLDDAGVELPVGAVGEIAARGRHLALGYWRRPELTAERFTDACGEDGIRQYRTGDLGRLRPDGCLEYLGRKDFGLKVSGHRVEPGEIENALLKLPGVAEALVATVAGRRGEGRLHAFVVAGEGVLPSPRELRRRLAEELPSYLVPSMITPVPALPLGANGKLDRTLLATPSRSPAAPEHDDPLMRDILGACSDVLETPILPQDDLVALGLDSLAAVELAAALERATGAPLHPALFGEQPTPESVAALIRFAPDAIVPLQKGATDRPLYLVHDGNGSVWIYRQLVRRLPPELTVLGIQGTGPPTFETVSELAARHVAAIRARQPVGPYALGGFCFGAVLAFEIARQLDQAGQELAPLLLIGVDAWDFRLVRRKAWRRYLQERGVESVGARIRTTVRQAGRLGLGAGTRHILRAGRSAPAYIRIRRGDRPQRSPSADAWTNACAQAFATYRPVRHPGTAVLLVAETSTAAYSEDPEADWAPLADRVAVQLLPGRNHTLLTPPAVDALARAVTDVLDPVTRPGERDRAPGRAHGARPG